MPELSNARYEVFAKALVDGLKTVDAYEMAGFARSPSAASQLKSKPEIQQRMQELIKEKHERALDIGDDIENLPSELNRDWLIRTLMKNVDLAQRASQIAPANKAVEMLAQIIGINFKQPGVPPKDDDDDKKADNLDLDKMGDAFDKLAKMLPPAPEKAE